MNNQFISQYKLSKTIKQELIPVGKTAEYLQKDENDFIKVDEERAENFLQAKQILDKWYRNFIDKALKNVSLDFNPLFNFLSLPKEDQNKKDGDKIKKALGEGINKAFIEELSHYNFKASKDNDDDEDTDDSDVDDLDEGSPSAKKAKSLDSLFKKELIEFIKKGKTNSIISDEDKAVLEKFNKFYTYFVSYFETRKNVFTKDLIATSVASRAVNDNFLRYFSDLLVYKTQKDQCPEILQKLELQLKEQNIITCSLDEVFSVNSFNKYISQSGIDNFNKVVGDINLNINLAIAHDESLKVTLKQKRATKYNFLYKQILSDRASNFVIDEFTRDEDAISAVKENFEELNKPQGVLEKLAECFSAKDMGNDSLNIENIYIKGKNINAFSAFVFGGSEWNKIRSAYIENAQSKKPKFNEEKFNTEFLKKDHSLAEIVEVLKEEEQFLVNVFVKIKDLFSKIGDVYAAKNWPSDLKSDKNKNIIKEKLDALMALFHNVSLFDSESTDKDMSFYGTYDSCIVSLKDLFHLYNKVRNFATKKPYSTKKFKLNFNSPTTGAGWSLSKEGSNLTTLYYKDGYYYLGIYKKGAKDVIEEFHKMSESKIQGIEDGDKNCYTKVNYFYIPNTNRMVPKCTLSLKDVKKQFANKNTDEVVLEDGFNQPLTITRELFTLYSKRADLAKSMNNEYKKFLTLYIDFAKEFYKKYTSATVFDISSLKDTSEYKNIKDFFTDLDKLSYKVTFTEIPENKMNELIDSGKLYLFQIYNKDYAKGHKQGSKKNLHTMYLESLFSKENLEKGVLKLNGNSEFFYRRQSLKDENIIRHKKDSIVVNRLYCADESNKVMKKIPDDLYEKIKEIKNGKRNVEDLSGEELEIYKKAKSFKTDHEIIKDRRFTKDKYFFHFSFTINYKAPSLVSDKEFNQKVQDYIKNDKELKIIGIDRGERNLIYISLIDQNGKIIEQKSFNTVTNKGTDSTYEVDYNDILQSGQQRREQQRKSWNEIQKITTIKEGYLSAVIHEIASMMVKHDAIVVLENLNAGFKRVRGGISEKSVYQKFEKMLIEKLNYLVFKDITSAQKGGNILNGYQLSGKFETFQKLGYQSGFIFYVPAAYTSKIDPTTGFSNVVSMGHYSTVEKVKEFFGAVTSIRFLSKENLFKFAIDFSKLQCTVKLPKGKTNWDIYSVGERIVKTKEKEDKSIVLTDEIKNLFKKNNIDYSKETELIEEIRTKDSKFLNELFWLIKTTLQLRNSSNKLGEDYIISPVKGKEGFFNSNKANPELPIDADANGAYHIALKGLLYLNKLRETNDNKKANNAIKKEGWFDYVLKRN